MPSSRRALIRHASLLAGTGVAAGLLGLPLRSGATQGSPFNVSLAQWSLHRTYFGRAFGPDFRAAFRQDPDSVLQGELDPLNFPVLAREAFGIDAVEYVNTFFFSQASNPGYLSELKRRADGEGVRSLLIMCDALGNTGDQDPGLRRQAAENHFPWLDAAAYFGCHAIRVNAAGQGTHEELSRRVAESLRVLAERAAPLGLSVLVENHGGLSSDGGWLAETITRADHPGVGTLPDFGNFRLSARGQAPVELYDRYQGLEELMPFARAVSAKSYDFDTTGYETTIDYERMMAIVTDAGYRGYVGVEYEGSRLSEFEGIRATRDLLLRIRRHPNPPLPADGPE